MSNLSKEAEVPLPGTVELVTHRGVHRADGAPCRSAVESNGPDPDPISRPLFIFCIMLILKSTFGGLASTILCAAPRLLP